MSIVIIENSVSAWIAGEFSDKEVLLFVMKLAVGSMCSGIREECGLGSPNQLAQPRERWAFGVGVHF